MLTGRFLLLVECVFLIQLHWKGLYARPSLDPDSYHECPNTGLPLGTPKGSNVIYGTKPLFKLNINQLRGGYLPNQAYTFNVQAQDPSRKFGGVLLSVWPDDDRCGHGHFTTDPTLYYQPEQCSHMVFKNTRSFNHTFTFQWAAPRCGCLVFRARVHSEENIYYLENENVMEGYLSKRVCPKGVSTIISQMSQFQRTDVLCKVMDSAQRPEMSINKEFLNRRKIQYEDVSRLRLEALRIAREQRVYEINQCCAKVGLEKEDCLGDIRRHRIDQFCADREPLVPFTSLRHDYMIKRRDDCCWRLGERRYKCFTHGGEREMASVHGEFHNDPQHDAFVYLDESDPINDLEDYPYRLSEEFSIRNLYVEEPVVQKPIPRKGKLVHANHGSNTAEEPPLERVRIPPRTKPASRRVQEQQSSAATPQETGDRVATLTPTQSETTSAPVSRVTQTTKNLQREIKLAKVKLNCCKVGEVYGAPSLVDNSWDMCRKAAKKYTKSMPRWKKRKCTNYYHRCCVEAPKSVQHIEETEDRHSNEALATSRPESNEMRTQINSEQQITTQTSVLDGNQNDGQQLVLHNSEEADTDDNDDDDGNDEENDSDDDSDDDDSNDEHINEDNFADVNNTKVNDDDDDNDDDNTTPSATPEVNQPDEIQSDDNNDNRQAHDGNDEAKSDNDEDAVDKEVTITTTERNHHSARVSQLLLDITPKPTRHQQSVQDRAGSDENNGDQNVSSKEQTTDGPEQTSTLNRTPSSRKSSNKKNRKNRRKGRKRRKHHKRNQIQRSP